MNDLLTMSADQMREEIGRAVEYRDGPGMMNTIYLGGMAAAGIVKRLGGRYGEDSIETLLVKATAAQLVDVAEYEGFLWIYGHYVKAGRKLFEFEIIKREI